jgi:drug/metabolite transporter (DMT)-like permease
MLPFFKAFQHLDVTTASASLHLVPVFGVFLAAVRLGERPNILAMVENGNCSGRHSSNHEI